MLFKLKDTEVLEITPIYKDEHYEEGWCETWIDNKFIENKEYKYFITEFAALVDSI